MEQPAIEIVTFRLRDGIDPQSFGIAAAAIMPFVRSLEGFLERHLCELEDGSWIDVVRWSSLADAKNAAAMFQKASEVSEFASMIDFSTIDLRHGAIVPLR